MRGEGRGGGRGGGYSQRVSWNLLMCMHVQSVSTLYMYYINSDANFHYHKLHCIRGATCICTCTVQVLYTSKQ